ncbi:MAG: heme o synthase [Planctomycetota bacterium]|jgi:protoheme IX farnesyltransferase
MSVPRAAAAELPVSSGLSDYMTLSKMRLNTLVVVTTLGGVWIGSGGTASWSLILQTVIATGLVAVGASALNQVMEIGRDARMHRTMGRPLPSGRMHTAEALSFGVGCSVAGLAWLAASVNLLAMALAAITLLTYLAVYTPMKGRSAYNTLVGAVPGAVPPLIGWAAAGNGLDAGAWVLFAILYLWQIPHFLSIAWLFREDYARAGFVMLPGVDRDGISTGRQAVLHTVALVIVSLFATTTGIAGVVYAVGALVVGGWFAWVALGFARRRSGETARVLLRASLVYLPVLFTLMALDLN